MKIGKQFRWEMGHRLVDHTRGCHNIHGHSYRLVVELEGEPDALGIVVDFGDLKEIVKTAIDQLDHAFMCENSDGIMKNFLTENSFKAVYVPFPTTAENICVHFMNIIAKAMMAAGVENSRMKDRISIVRVRVWETDSCYAELERKVGTELL